MKRAGDAARLAPWLPYLAARLGWTGWAGIGALLLGLAGIGFAVPLADRGNARLLAGNATLQAQLARLSDPQAVQRARDPLAALLASLPPSSRVPDFVAAIQRRAEQAEVRIDRTEYRVQPLLGQAAQSVRLRFPAHADYPRLRSWLEGLLHDYPSLSLDEISLRREADGGEELESSIGLSLLVRAAP